MSDLIYLQNVRLSFPFLVEPRSDGETSAPKYIADLLMPKDHNGFSEFMKVYGKLALAKWGEHTQQVMQMIQADRKFRCYGPGSEKVNKKTFKCYDGYEGNVYLSANNRSSPQMIKPDGNPVDPGNTMEVKAVARTMYGGCYVNAAVKPWVQDNKHGRGIRLELVAIQFNADGQAFGEGSPDVSGMFGVASVQSTEPSALPSGFGIPDLPFQM